MVLVVGAAMIVAVQMAIHRAQPTLKSRVIETLSARFDSKVELDEMDVSVFRGLEVSGKGLRVFATPELVAAGVSAPEVVVQSFHFHAGVLGIFLKPTHVGTIYVQGLEINIPPREMRAHQTSSRRMGKVKMEVDYIVVDNSRLVIGTAKPDKDPKVFDLKHVVLTDVGPNFAWPYDATLTNAVPAGDIHAKGKFGPWNNESPGDSSVSGDYQFDHADLNTIRGLGGMLTSTGQFTGQLNKIAVHGTTDTPNFSLDSADHPLPLHTTFSAIVDGTTGDTYLQPVEARLRNSAFSCRGAIVNIKGVGHTIDLDVNVPAGKLQDFLQLAVKTMPPVMTAEIETRTKLDIHPGTGSVMSRMKLDGGFRLQKIHFTNPQVEDKVDMLSLRAEGKPQEAKPGAEDVNSQMTGRFVMQSGKLDFSQLNFEMPGATAALHGNYTLDGRVYDFEGVVRTKAKLSQMIASRWKSLLLKPVDPFFHKNGAGAQIPVKITGTNSAPKFGLNLGH